MSGYLRKMARKQMRANHAVFRRTVRDHEDLLQSIEDLFVTRARLTGLVDALRVVAGSIRNHSQRLAGQVDYLTFVDLFIP